MGPLDVLSLADAKSYLKTDFNDDDDLITSLIGAAVSMIEQATEYRLYQRNEVIYMTNNRYGYEAFQHPLNAAAVVAQDSQNTTVYTVLYDYKPLRTYLFWGQGFCYWDNWVEFFTNYTYRISAKVQTFILTLDVGYIDTTQIPFPLITAVKQMVVFLYENRDMTKLTLPDNIMLLCEPYKRFATIV
jgi:hypothetical protein